MSKADINFCKQCLEQQIKIDYLLEENQHLKNRLLYFEKKSKEGYFGSSTPSSKKPFKENKNKDKKKKGKKKGEKGYGRKSHTESDETKQIECEEEYCSYCGNLLEDKGYKKRSVKEAFETAIKDILYFLNHKYCSCCKKTFSAKAPNVIPRNLYGNQLIANIIDMHYNMGVPINKICQNLDLNSSTVIRILQKLSDKLEPVYQELIKKYRESEVRHADETGWRVDGMNCYTWLFATQSLSIFKFGENRSGQVPRKIFGEKPLDGFLVVDRYAGYNKLPVNIQYCYAHLLRDIENLEDKFPNSIEIKNFVASLTPKIALAMKLKNQEISDKDFLKKAKKLKKDIKKIIHSASKHLGIKKIQEIFLNNEHRMYHWINRKVPADNNLAERDLRPSVIARKLSYGSVSKRSAQIRSVLTTVCSTLKKQDYNVNKKIKELLDSIAINNTNDLFTILFPKLKYP